MNNNNTSPIASVEVVPPVPVQPTYRLTLNLTAREAVALRSLCRKIGGPPEDSARNVFDSIASALHSNGIGSDDSMIEEGCAIYFNRWPDQYR